MSADYGDVVGLLYNGTRIERCSLDYLLEYQEIFMHVTGYRTARNIITNSFKIQILFENSDMMYEVEGTYEMIQKIVNLIGQLGRQDEVSINIDIHDNRKLKFLRWLYEHHWESV